MMSETKDGQPTDKSLRECEVQLDDARALSSAREQLLLANIRELNEVYETLRQKISDIRERDERIRGFDEVLTRANRLSSLGELALSIAHEIKNPLISIQGFAHRITETNEPDKVERYARFIEQEAERLSTVLLRLLDFSRMTAPKKEHLDINGLVDDTILFTQHHLTLFRRVELTVHKEDGLPKVHADKVHIQQALMNIIMNAAQAMPEGGPIVVETGKRDDQVFISVTDKGTGIKQEELERIFEPFFTTKPQGEGTGLGLPLTKRLVEANEGRIEIDTAAGQGSTFRVLLPAVAETSVQ